MSDEKNGRETADGQSPYKEAALAAHAADALRKHKQMLADAAAGKDLDEAMALAERERAIAQKWPGKNDPATASASPAYDDAGYEPWRRGLYTREDFQHVCDSFNREVDEHLAAVAEGDGLHTLECVMAAAKTRRSFCIAPCADERRRRASRLHTCTKCGGDCEGR